MCMYKELGNQGLRQKFLKAQLTAHSAGHQGVETGLAMTQCSYPTATMKHLVSLIKN